MTLLSLLQESEQCGLLGQVLQLRIPLNELPRERDLADVGDHVQSIARNHRRVLLDEETQRRPRRRRRIGHRRVGGVGDEAVDRRRRLRPERAVSASTTRAGRVSSCRISL